MIKNSRFYRAKNLQEALYHLKNVNNLHIYSGGTSIKQADNDTLLDIGEDCLFLTNCEELKRIEKHERYITFCSMVTLQQILDLGENNIPNFIYKAIESISNPLVRNKATLTGNICSSDFYHTVYSPLLAVDAKLEIHTPSETKFVQMSKFNGVEKGQIVTAIRIPLIDWDISLFFRTGDANQISDLSNSFTFLAKTQKDSLVDLRVAFCGKLKIRSSELENSLIGSRLPLSKKVMEMAMEKAEKVFDQEFDKYVAFYVEKFSSASVVNQDEKSNSELLADYEKNVRKNFHPMIKLQFLNLFKKCLEHLM